VLDIGASNVEIVRRIYAALNERDFDSLLKLSDPDGVFEFSRSIGPQKLRPELRRLVLACEVLDMLHRVREAGTTISEERGACLVGVFGHQHPLSRPRQSLTTVVELMGIEPLRSSVLFAA
jgi:hypothetical protein